MRIEEIKARLQEIREMLDDEEKRGKTTFSELEKEARELREELEELEAAERMKQSFKEGEERGKEEKEGKEDRDIDMNRYRQVNDGEGIELSDEQREAFDKYLETRDIQEDGLTLDEGYVVVPEDERKDIIELADDIVSLKQYVTVRPVSTGSGTQPVRTTARAKLHTVEELAESPALGVTPFTDVDFKVETKRGYIPYSEEYKQDGINLVPDLKQYMSEVVINTENDDILKELETIRGRTIDSLDGLKSLVNTGFSAGKSSYIKFLMGQSSFDELDKLKDGNERYLLQESISAPTGKKLFGKDIIVLDDEYFPTKQTMFVGDLREIVYFDRSQMRVQWTNYLHYGECLAVAVRNDTGKIEDEKTKVNIYKVNANFSTEPEVEEPAGA